MMSSTRQHDGQRFDDRDDDSNGRVAFPPHFDDGCKSRSRSGSEDGGNGKSRGSSGDSLGTKSGSTSLLSMMSGSPRSLGTAHDSATGGSPRTPLSDHSATDSGSASAAAAAGSRRGRGTSRTEEVLPAVSSGDGEDSDDMDLPSAHPTPLSAFGGGDTSLPSDHPTPDSTPAPNSLSRSRSRSRSRGSGAIDGDGKAPAGGTGSSKSITGSSGSFMARLKYWGGATANRQDGGPKKVTATAATHVGHTGQAATKASVVSPRKAPEIRGASERTSGSSGSSSSMTKDEERKPSMTVNNSDSAGGGGSDSRGRGTERRSEGGGSRGGGGSGDGSESESPPPYSESAASEAGGMSPCELRGCPVVPFDSVTSESMSAYGAAEPPPPYRPGGIRGSAGGVATGTGRSGPSPPYSAARLQGARSRPGSVSSSSSQHRNTAEEQTRLSPPTYGSFGAKHNVELEALRRARGGTPRESENDREDDEESDMDWEANSDGENDDQEEKTELAVPFSPLTSNSRANAEAAAAAAAETPTVKASPRPPPRFLADKSAKLTARTNSVEIPPQQMQELRQTPRQEVAPPRYMAIVEAANVSSALDTSSTSELDTSPSEDDGGMMAEILTDRLMEVCQKMEQVTAMPEDELSDGGGGDAAPGLGGAISKRRPSFRRRQMSNMSSRGFLSTNGLEEKDGDSDDGSAVDAGAAARKLRRER